MKKPILVTNPVNLNKEKWDELIEAHPQGNFFQSRIYYEFISAVDCFNPFIIAAKDENSDDLLGIIQGTIQREKGLKGFFSRRAIVIGGPLIKNFDANVLELLLKQLSLQLKNKVIYVEFRNLFDLNEYRYSFKQQGYTYKAHLNFLVSLNNLEQTRKNISKSKLRQIKKSFEKGLSIRKASSIADIQQFYNILKDLYIKKVKKPLPDWSFFENFFLKTVGVYLLIEHKEKIVGGIMCPTDKQKIYEWYVCGLDNISDEIFPSAVATYAAIIYGIDNHLHFFDFMGAGSPDRDYGVREFKARFGGELVEYGRYITVYNKPLYILGKFALYILRSIKKK